MGVRAKKQQNIFDSLACQFKGWVMGKTEGLQASLYYELVVKYALPPVYKDFFILRTATVNMGSRQKPSYITFWGIHHHWMLAPYIHLDLENVSVLDELDQQKTAGIAGTTG